MAVDALATLINDSHGLGECLVRENWERVWLSRLSASLARSIANLATGAMIDFAIIDGADNDVVLAEIDDVGAPYRLSLVKPIAHGEGHVITLRGLDELVLNTGGRAIVRMAGLSAMFETFNVAFTPWDARVTPGVPVPRTKSPRSVVREYGNERLAPASVESWVLREPVWLNDEPVFAHWAALAAQACLRALGDEIQEGPVRTVFKGPPRGVATDVATGTGVSKALFLALQACAKWVYETPTETEMRHPLLSAEIARFSSADGVILVVPAVFKNALEGARLAYQLGMSRLSSDTLKMLTDLRKSVLDETTKVADGTRQLIASVATTLSVGVGLVAAKVGTNADGRIVGAIAVITAVYVVAIVWSGFRSLRLQDEIRVQWKPRTYGFISHESYAVLVDEPATKAAASYRSIAWISLYLTAFMLAVVVWSIANFG